jgi:hypothetical protein
VHDTDLGQVPDLAGHGRRADPQRSVPPLWPGLTGGEIIDLLGRLRGGIDAKREKALADGVTLFGQVLRLPQGLMDLSPFTHTPRLPGATVHAAPLVWLCVVALVFCLAGLATLRRRDIS